MTFDDENLTYTYQSTRLENYCYYHFSNQNNQLDMPSKTEIKISVTYKLPMFPWTNRKEEIEDL